MKKNILRLLKAACMGFLWSGTSHFTPPEQFRWRGKKWALSMPPEDALKGVFRGVILDDEYGMQLLPITPNTILDVGGNVGIFSVWARANFPQAVIHAYEPNPKIQSFLLANSKHAAVTIHAEAVAEKDGRVSLNVSDGGSVGGRCAIDDSGPIPLTSLRKAIARIGGKCDLLKLDCEGAEWDMLKDPEAFKNVRCIRMEYHLFGVNKSIDSLVEAFHAMGFSTTQLIRDPERGIAWFDRKQSSDA